MPSSHFQAKCIYTDVLKLSCYLSLSILKKLCKRQALCSHPFPPTLVKYLLLMFALGSMDFQSHFYQRQGQEGAAIGSSKAASLWQKGAFERLKGKQGTWHPFFLWQLLGMFLTTPLKIKISALKGGEFNSAPSYPFSTVLSKAARGVCIRQSLRAWVDLQLAAHQMTSCVSGHNRTTANFFICISCLWSKSF